MASRTQHTLLSIGYGIGLMFIIVPAAELVMRFWPFDPASVAWRFGIVGLFANTLTLPVAGLVILVWTADARGRRRTVRAVSVLALVGTLALLVLSTSFMLDIVQVRPTVVPDMKRNFDVAAAKAIISLLAAMALLLWVGLAGWRASRAPQSAGAAESTRRVMMSRTAVSAKT